MKNEPGLSKAQAKGAIEIQVTCDHAQTKFLALFIASSKIYFILHDLSLSFLSICKMWANCKPRPRSVLTDAQVLCIF